MDELANPPYKGPYTIPVLIDDIKDLSADTRGDGSNLDFRMTRCTFFSIEAGQSKDDWYAALRQDKIPFLLLGIVPVLHRPNLQEIMFKSPEAISDLFDHIERVQELVVETSHIWLSNNLVKACLGPENNTANRGKILRVGLALFRWALLFQEGLTTQLEFEMKCSEAEVGADITYSPEESEVFKSWSSLQIKDAAKNYILQREDGRGVLDWKDESGTWQKG